MLFSVHRKHLVCQMLSLRVASQKWTLFCVHYYSKLLMHIYINYIPLEAWVHCLQTATVNWCWDNISTEIFKKKMDFFQYLAHPPLWKKQELGKTWRHGFSFSCGCIRKQWLFKPPDTVLLLVLMFQRDVSNSREKKTQKINVISNRWDNFEELNIFLKSKLGIFPSHRSIFYAQ